MSLAPKPSMDKAAPAQVRRPARRLLGGAVAAGVLASTGWLIAGVWGDVAAVGADVVRALWTVPAVVALHLVQLLLSALGWRVLFVQAPVGVGAFFRLRLMREGLNSLLPLAHVGGEVVAIQLMTRRGIPVALGAASVVVDVTVEVCAQLAFLVAGCLALVWLSGVASAWLWAGSLGIALLTAGGLLLAQRFQALRLLERAVEGIGRRWPALAISSIEGLNADALAIYRRLRRLAAAFLFQGTAWVLGTGETWLVLHALGVDATPGQAFVVESLGAAARSAGFAVPGALAIQEGGFVLAAAAVGLPGVPALSLSLVKRVREALVGLAGVACWRLALSVGARPAHIDQTAEQGSGSKYGRSR